MALRGVGGGAEVASEVAAERDRIRQWPPRLRGGELRGISLQPLRHLVCIGIGGSDLGPAWSAMRWRRCAPEPGRCVRRPLRRQRRSLRPASGLADLDPAVTGFVVVSKTFTTRETLANAEAARRWLRAGGADNQGIGRHLIGVTATPRPPCATESGRTRFCGSGDWVGGRYSLVVARSASRSPSPAAPRLRRVARRRRCHGRALSGTHRSSTTCRPGWADVDLEPQRPGLRKPGGHPYAERLRLLPAFLQQLVMESNGKSALLDGTEPTSRRPR
jgi:glucose-6-phosphate isomerase